MPAVHLKVVLTLEMPVVDLKFFERTLLHGFHMAMCHLCSHTIFLCVRVCVCNVSQKFISVVLQNDTAVKAP